jgi:DNA-directed RNA polymerase specialized sigma24 family protein
VPTDAIDSFDELEYVIAGGEHPAKMAEAEHLAALISGYVRTLSRRRKYVFMARYFAARSIAGVAEALSCSEATVNRDIARIRDELRALLKKEGYLC